MESDHHVIASPSELLAITGSGINDVKVTKKAYVAPGQLCTRLDISPANYTLEVQAMSAEKLPFILGAVFTIGPRDDDKECLLRYVKLISPPYDNEFVKGVIEGVIQGEARVLAASMTMEEIFRGTESFKQALLEKGQLELNKLGLVIYNANVKQLVDVPGHEYLSHLGQKKKAELATKKARWEQKAKVAQVEANKAVEIREAELQAEVERRNAARQTEKLNAEYNMKVQQANWELYNRQMAADALLYEREKEAEAAFFARQREADVELYATQKAAEGLMKFLKVKVVGAEVLQFEQDKQATAKYTAAEAAFFVRQREADAELYAKQKEAEGLTKLLKVEVVRAKVELYSREKAAEGLQFVQDKEAAAKYTAAEATFFARQREAEAELYAKQKEAEGLAAMLGALGGSYGALRDYLMLSSGMYLEMARINPEALRGFEPSTSTWSNGGVGAAI